MRRLLLLLIIGLAGIPFHSAGREPNACAAIPPGLVGWWPGEGDGADYSGLYEATLDGTTFESGRVGQAFQFDGINDTVVVDGLPLNTAAFSYETWVYVDPTPPEKEWADLFVAGETFTEHQGRNILLNLHSDKLTSYPDILSSTLTLVPQQWYHIAYTSDGLNHALYIMGSLQDSRVFTDTAITSQRLTIGNWPSYDEYWAGRVDEFSFYNRTLTSSEIRAIAAAGSAGKCERYRAVLPFVRR